MGKGSVFHERAVLIIDLQRKVGFKYLEALGQ